MKYPLDDITLNESIGHVVAHERAQNLTIKLLVGLLIEAMGECEDRESDWYQEADKFLQLQLQLKMEHENRIFDEDNLRKARGMLPKERPQAIHHSVARATSPINIPDVSSIEANLGEELSETDLAVHFSEPPKKSKKVKEKALKEMTMEEINEWEAKQNNSNDIYKVKARVANLARSGGGSLTDQGEMLCNTFVHVLKSMYDFAETIEDKTLRIKLIENIRKHEGMPANLIAAAGAGVKQK